MNIIKTAILITSLSLIMIGCGDKSTTANASKNYKIKGVFGVNLGDKAQNLPDGYLDNNKAFDFTPTHRHKSFISYTISVTPNTHKIYGIKVASSKELSTASCKEKRDALIKETLAPLGDTSTLRINEKGNQWKITERSDRSIVIDCERTLVAGTHQLVMTYTDRPLSKLSFVEWNKHQDDITKSH